MARLLLVKHSFPEIRRNEPPASWRLSREGRERARTLARHLEGAPVGRILSSHEPKAIETAQITAEHLGLEASVCQGLHEHVLEDEWFESRARFEAACRRFFEHPNQRVLGRETASEAKGRFAAAVSSVLEGPIGGDLVLVTHGRVLSLFAAPCFGSETFSFWKRLGLPALVVLSLPELEGLEVRESFPASVSD